MSECGNRDCDNGRVLAVIPDHHPSCDGTCRDNRCPIPVQVEERCDWPGHWATPPTKGTPEQSAKGANDE